MSKRRKIGLIIDPKKIYSLHWSRPLTESEEDLFFRFSDVDAGKDLKGHWYFRLTGDSYFKLLEYIKLDGKKSWESLNLKGSPENIDGRRILG
jgi:hypothetical protein